MMVNSGHLKLGWRCRHGFHRWSDPYLHGIEVALVGWVATGGFDWTCLRCGKVRHTPLSAIWDGAVP